MTQVAVPASPVAPDTWPEQAAEGLCGRPPDCVTRHAHPVEIQRKLLRGKPCGIRATVSGEDVKSIQRRIIELQSEHRDLDEVVNALSQNSNADQLLIKRIKKRKLQLKDEITRLKSRMIPDLDA